MAYKMKLHSPHEGMPHIWNISREVGVRGEAANCVDDVELVQRLILERYKVVPSKTSRADGIGWLTTVTGQMDAQTGFEMYWIGNSSKTLSDAEVISPARGGTLRYGSGFWTIGYLNWKLFAHAPEVWTMFPELCSPMLKAALLTKTSP